MRSGIHLSEKNGWNWKPEFCGSEILPAVPSIVFGDNIENIDPCWFSGTKSKENSNFFGNGRASSTVIWDGRSSLKFRTTKSNHTNFLLPTGEGSRGDSLKWNGNTGLLSGKWNNGLSLPGSVFTGNKFGCLGDSIASSLFWVAILLGNRLGVAGNLIWLLSCFSKSRSNLKPMSSDKSWEVPFPGFFRFFFALGFGENALERLQQALCLSPTEPRTSSNVPTFSLPFEFSISCKLLGESGGPSIWSFDIPSSSCVLTAPSLVRITLELHLPADFRQIQVEGTSRRAVLSGRQPVWPACAACSRTTICKPAQAGKPGYKYSENCGSCLGACPSSCSRGELPTTTIHSVLAREYSQHTQQAHQFVKPLSKQNRRRRSHLCKMSDECEFRVEIRDFRATDLTSRNRYHTCFTLQNISVFISDNSSWKRILGSEISSNSNASSMTRNSRRKRSW